MFIFGFLLGGVLLFVLSYLMGKKNLYVYSAIEIPGVSQKELFDFITNIENDYKWYAGVNKTEVITEGSADLIGRRYVQNGEFNGVAFKNNIEFMATSLGDQTSYISFIGRGFALNYTAHYLFETTADGIRFTNISTVSNARFGYLFSDYRALWDEDRASGQISTYLAEAQLRLAEAMERTPAEKRVRAAVISQ